MKLVSLFFVCFTLADNIPKICIHPKDLKKEDWFKDQDLIIRAVDIKSAAKYHNSKLLTLNAVNSDQHKILVQDLSNESRATFFTRVNAIEEMIREFGIPINISCYPSAKHGYLHYFLDRKVRRFSIYEARDYFFDVRLQIYCNLIEIFRWLNEKGLAYASANMDDIMFYGEGMSKDALISVQSLYKVGEKVRFSVGSHLPPAVQEQAQKENKLSKDGSLKHHINVKANKSWNTWILLRLINDIENYTKNSINGLPYRHKQKRIYLKFNKFIKKELEAKSKNSKIFEEVIQRITDTLKDCIQLENQDHEHEIVLPEQDLPEQEIRFTEK